MGAYKFTAEAPSSEVQNHRSRRRGVRVPAVLSLLQMLQETRSGFESSQETSSRQVG